MCSLKTPQRQKTQIDHGYAWVILGSCFLMRFILDGFWSVLGMLMIKWEDHFSVSASQTAWAATLFVMVAYVTSPVSSALGNRLTYRVTVIGAGMIASTCLMAASLATHFWYLYVILPILGIGMSVVFQTSSSYYVRHFNKRFAFANGLFSIAPAIAFFIFPPFTKVLIDYFGLRGALQIVSAITANICVCGALLRSPKNVKTQDGHPIDVKNDEKITNNNSILKDIVKDFDLVLFRKVRFIFQSVINGFLYGGFVSLLIYIIPYSESVGITDIKSPLLMSTVAACSLTARLIPFGYLVDKNVISASSLAGAASILSGTVSILMTFMENFAGLAVLAGLYGIGWGVTSTFIIVIVAHSGGSKESSSGAIAWTLLGRGVGSFVCIYGGGVLRDEFSSYQPSLILCGVFGLCLALNILSDPFLERWKSRHRPTENQTTLKSIDYIYSSIPDVTTSAPV
ncbi:monocarboxylate transporter 12-like [Amphiura filiformis]|uniref:monocarboxylate transporter 12-like n=1 Tax=Amphiura filiformis TaxID=82378 RepID=UPI003B21C888